MDIIQRSTNKTQQYHSLLGALAVHTDNCSITLTIH